MTRQTLPVYLSLGAGVQSTTLALLAAEGAIGPVEAAIFADTRWEPVAVYEHLERLRAALPYPVHVVTAGNLRTDVLAPRPGRRMANPPLFTAPRGILRRQCTESYKVEPIRRKLRQLLGYRPRQRMPKAPIAVQWIGYSTDEAHRMKPSRDAWLDVAWPLLDLRMSRRDCVRWLADRGWTEPPKSACVGCPYHDDAYWRRMRDGSPREWADAVDFDARIRNGRGGVRQACYVHDSRVPLGEVDLSTAVERGQLELGFGNDCGGMCGT